MSRQPQERRPSIADELKRAGGGGRPATLVEADENHILGVWHHLVAVIWRGQTMLSAVVRLEGLLHSYSKQIGASVTFFTVVEEGAPLPVSEVREASAKVLKKAPLRASALTFEGSGFRAAAVRGVAVGIGMLARLPYPHRAFANVEEAAVWVAGYTREDGQGAMSAHGVKLAIEELRRADPAHDFPRTNTSPR
jgi:hypothetical protein